jgi:hypothetical protein
MGGLEQVSSREFVAYTGGKPNSTWTGLDPLVPKSRQNSGQFRYISGASSITAEDLRRHGLSTKFSKGSDLVAFTREVKKKLETYGMDTIAYVPSTVTKSHMVHIVDSHAIFGSVEVLVSQMKLQRKRYDNYDRANDNDARHFLKNSLDAEFLRTIETLQDSANDTFPVLFLRVMEYNAKHTSGHLDELKKELKKVVPQNYPGQNISSMCAAIREKTDVLEASNAYDHTITKEICNRLLVAGGEVATENVGQFHFSQEIKAFYDKLRPALLHISQLPKSEQDSYMAQEGLTIRSLIDIAVSSYAEQVSENNWMPAKHASDSKAVNPNFGANVLIQNAPGNSSNTGPPSGCFNCGAPDHYARNCPSAKGQPNRGFRQQGRGGGRGHNNRGGRGYQQGKPPPKNTPAGGNNWQRTPPKPGEPESRMMNGKPFQWCTLCGRWSTTHGTLTHRGSASKSKEAPSNDPKPKAGYHLGLIPSAWMASFGYAGPGTGSTSNETRTSFGDQFVAEWRADRIKKAKMKKLEARKLAKIKREGCPRKLKTARSTQDKQRCQVKQAAKAKRGLNPTSEPAAESTPFWMFDCRVVLAIWALVVLSCPSSIDTLFSWIGTAYSWISATTRFRRMSLSYSTSSLQRTTRSRFQSTIGC